MDKPLDLNSIYMGPSFVIQLPVLQCDMLHKIQPLIINSRGGGKCLTHSTRLLLLWNMGDVVNRQSYLQFLEGLIFALKSATHRLGSRHLQGLISNIYIQRDYTIHIAPAPGFYIQ